MERITMGSVYLDKGESFDYVLEQVQRMAILKVTSYYFDVICSPDQLKEATAIIDYFYKIVGELVPTCPPNRRYVGITCNEEVRPAAMALAIQSQDQGIQIADVNPERPGR